MIRNLIDVAAPSPRRRCDRAYFNRAGGRSFEARTSAKRDVTEITLYDEIGYFGISAKDMRAALDEITTPRILLRVNSPGGDVFDGIAIHNDLERHPAEVDVEITGLAASAASIVAMAGDRIEMADNAFMMIHNAWALAIGNRHDMLELAGVLAQIDGALAATYAARSGKSVDEVAALLDAETWLSAEAAVEQGFADAIADAPAAAEASFDLSGFRNTPERLLKSRGAVPRTVRDLERGLRDAGYSRSDAKTLAASVFADKPLRDAGAIDADTVAALQRLSAALAA